MPYSGYTSKELVALFHLTRQALKQSGLLALLPKSYPFGQANPLYREPDVIDWSLRLTRRRALIALGRLSPKSTILSAPDDDRWDDLCPHCGGLAIADPEPTVEEYIALANAGAGTFPRRLYCDKCGII